MTTSRALPLHRGDCLTSARRYHLALRDADDDRPPTVGGWTTTWDAGGFRRVPTDGLPDGRNSKRPCGYLTCKYHVAVEYNPLNGHISVMWTAPERLGRGMNTEYLTDEAGDYLVAELERVREALRAWEASPEGHLPGATPPEALQTCALDLADVAFDEEQLTLDRVGQAARKTRERVRQVSDAAFAALRGEALTLILAARDDEDARPSTEVAIPPVEYEDGSTYPALRRSGSNVTVACTSPGCERRFTAREPRLLAMPAPFCRDHAPKP